MKLRKILLKIVSEKYKITFEAAEKYVHLSIDSLGKNAIVQIMYDKVKYSQKEFYDVLGSVHNYIKEYNLSQLTELAKSTYAYGKSKVVQSYEKFLGIEASKDVGNDNDKTDTSK